MKSEQRCEYCGHFVSEHGLKGCVHQSRPDALKCGCFMGNGYYQMPVNIL